MRGLYVALIMFVLLSQGFAFAEHAMLRPQTGSGQMVVMKVKPEWKHVLPQGIAASSGLPPLDMAFQKTGAIGIRRLHPHAIVRDDLPRLDLMLELELPATVDPGSVVESLQDLPELEWIETTTMPVADEIPDDPQYTNQYHLPNIMAPEAWDNQHGDSTVVIAIVDSGTDYNHPDLWANVHTNEIEASGTPGIDDDGNGFVDDIHGYDVADNDADPTPTAGQTHGTIVAGAAAAVTNNGIGVAAPSWNCEYLPVKVNEDTGTPGVMQAAYEGVAYAAEAGADIINCSWGHHGDPSQYDQDVIDYATGLGSLVIASAGNEPIGAFHWPSSYLNVVSVTWVDRNDIRAGNATWGRTVDMSAPGVGIRTTTPGGGYGSANGSSLSSPVAAGVAGLIKSWSPWLGPDELARQLVLTSDNIDDLNQGFEGLLGIGRVNAYRSVTETNLEEHPYLETWAWSVTDSGPGGNGDGWLLQGETGSLWITYRSFTVSPSRGLTITLSTSAPGISVINAISDEGDAPADTILTACEALTFQIDQAAPSQRAEMFITYEDADGFWQQDTLYVSVGIAAVLVVDDDDGEVNVEAYYQTVLDTLGVSYLMWDHSVQGEPDSLTLLKFPAVIWSCEWSFPSLTPVDRVSLGAYLDGGGSLYLSGQDIGWDLCDAASDNTSPEAVAWYNEYIHATYVADNSNIQSVTGVQTDPIGSGLSFGVYQPGREGDNQYPSVIDPNGADSYAVFQYNSNMDAAVRYRREHGVVYTAFGFEAVASGANIDPVDHGGTRTELMARILDYLGPIFHTPLRDTEDVSAPFLVTATVGAPGAPDTLWLAWTTDPVAGFTEVLMEHQGAGSYTGQIPAPSGPSDIWYYLEARDTSMSWKLPVRDNFRFHAGPDVVPPGLGEPTQLAAAIMLDSSRPVEITASDNLGLDIESGLLHYITGDDEGETPLSFQSWIGDEATLLGFLEPVGSYGDTVYYFCSIQDTAATPNTGWSDTLFYVYGLEDFESGLENWDPDTEWIRATGGNAPSGEWIARDSPGTMYQNNMDNSLTLLSGMDLSTTASARVSLWALHALEEDHDFCYLEASRDGNNWTVLVTLTGREMTWTKHTASLSDFIGQGAESVLIRLRLVSDAETTMQGVYLDDVYVETGVVGSYENAEPLPSRPTLAIGPNPSRGKVSFRIVGIAEASKVNIYNLTGRLVRTLGIPNDNEIVQWDGRDAQGSVVSSGLYFVKVSKSALRGKLIRVR